MQFSLFDGAEKFKINKPIRLIELFAGIGAQAAALRNIGADFEHYRICEFDKYAVQSYNAVHGTNFATSDITTITAEDLGVTETDKFCYIMTYSFPCTDLSQAGQMKGMQKGSGTRSGLLWEVERLFSETSELPQVLLMENVPQILTAEGFADWIEFLENLGYKNRYEVLNAKDFGIPQNRERAFMVSLLGDFYYEFPKTKKLEMFLSDVLEKEVDEKFYITNVQFENVIKNNFTQEKLRLQQKEYCDTILARDYKSPKLVCVGKLNNPPYDKMHDISKRVYSCGGLSPTIHTCGGATWNQK